MLPSVSCCWWSPTLIMWYQSYRCHGRFCYYLLIYLFVYHLLLLLSITYICFAISYSPLKSHKKTYSHFVVLLLCVRFVHLVASHHLCSSAVLLFNFYPHPSYVIVCLLKKRSKEGCVADCVTTNFIYVLRIVVHWQQHLYIIWTVTPLCYSTIASLEQPPIAPQKAINRTSRFVTLSTA